VDSRPFGGNLKILGNAELLFPIPFMSDVESVRLGLFFDVGTLQGPQQLNGVMVSSDFKVSDFKYSTGMSAQWLSPFGALQVSYAMPLNDDVNDEVQMFQFSFGSQF